MALYEFNEVCPNCGRPIKLFVESADGIPNEAEAECECGKIPVFDVQWSVDIWIGGFDHYYEPSNNGLQRTGQRAPSTVLDGFMEQQGETARR